MPTIETIVRHPQAEDVAEWVRMRVALWPEGSADSHAAEIAAYLFGNLTGWFAGLHAFTAFIAQPPDGGLCGFLEASVRPMVDGCTTHPVGYIEGWFVDPDVRQKRVGKALMEAAERWVLSHGCREMASDAYLTNSIGIDAHKALGFNEEMPTVRFRKWLLAPAGEEQPEIHTTQKQTLVPPEEENAD
jgi:aminoglycoside 6'-N-acetyltransferase I